MKYNQLCTQTHEIRDTLTAEVAEPFVWVFYSCCLCQTGNMRCQYCRIQNPLWLPVLLAWEVHKYYKNNTAYPGYIVLPLTGNEKYFLVKGSSITLS